MDFCNATQSLACKYMKQGSMKEELQQGILFLDYASTFITPTSKRTLYAFTLKHQCSVRKLYDAICIHIYCNK